MTHAAAPEISEAEAAAEAPVSAVALADIATGIDHRGGISEHRYWCEAAGTYTCHTCVDIPGQPEDILATISDMFFNAASMSSQPWYPEFKGGHSLPATAGAAADTLRQQRVCASFDLHVGKPRCYRQLISEHRPAENLRVLVARSIDDPQGEIALQGVLAYTLPPNGEVFEWQDGVLLWHHICTTPGARVLPGALDRWLINGLRRFGLDSAERDTYRREATLLKDWITSGALRA